MSQDSRSLSGSEISMLEKRQKYCQLTIKPQPLHTIMSVYELLSPDASNIVAYTDGSSGENGDKIMSAGDGIYSEKAGISESLALGEGMGVYDAELEGIYQTTQRICGQRRFRKKNITIFSDNQAAVRWARQLGPGQGQHLSRKLHDIAIRQRQHGGSLQVECVPGHC
jgi:ribonuclease HI